MWAVQSFLCQEQPQHSRFVRAACWGGIGSTGQGSAEAGFHWVLLWQHNVAQISKLKASFMNKSAGDHFTLVTLACPDGNRKTVTTPNQNQFSSTWSLTWQQLHSSDLHFCLHQDTLYKKLPTQNLQGILPAASLSATDHSAPVFHSPHRGVKIKNQL